MPVSAEKKNCKSSSTEKNNWAAWIITNQKRTNYRLYIVSNRMFVCNETSNCVGKLFQYLIINVSKKPINYKDPAVKLQ